MLFFIHSKVFFVSFEHVEENKEEKNITETEKPTGRDLFIYLLRRINTPGELCQA